MNTESSQTPILDLVVPLPSPKSKKSTTSNLKWWQTLFVVIGIVVGSPTLALLGLRFPVLANLAKQTDRLSNWIGNQMLDSPTELIVTLAVLIPAAFLFCVLLHEMGHVLAGLATGAKFRALSVAFLRLQFTDEKWKLQFQRPKILGFARMKYGTLRANRARLAIFISGGPFANLVTGLCVGPFCEVPSILSYLQFFLRAVTVFSFFFAITELIPVRAKGFFSDGARLWMLAFSEATAERWFAIQNLTADVEAGVRARELNDDWIKAAGALEDDTRDEYAGRLLIYYKLLDLKQYETAALNLERWLALNYLSGATADICLLEAAFFQAWARDNAEKASTWYSRTKQNSNIPALLRKRASIAIHVANRNFESARAEFAESVAIVNAYREPRRSRSLTSWEEWRLEIEERAKVANPQLASDAAASC